MVAVCVALGSCGGLPCDGTQRYGAQATLGACGRATAARLSLYSDWIRVLWYVRTINPVREQLLSDTAGLGTKIKMVVLHGLFAYCVGLQWRLSTPVPVYVDALEHVIQQRSGHNIPWRTLWLLQPVRLYTARSRDEGTVSLQHVAHATNAHGEPQRCWRDQCRGHWKPPRMRHCGVCGECRFFFDHHCIWVRNDVSDTLV